MMVTDVLLDFLCVHGGLKCKPVMLSYIKLCFLLAGLSRPFNVYRRGRGWNVKAALSGNWGGFI